MIYHAHDKGRGYSQHLDDLGITVRDTVAALSPLRDEFDSIVVTGMSGVLVGSPVSLALKKPLVVIRKKNDDSHSHTDIINRRDAGARALFLDDFTSSGDTRRRVVAAMQPLGVDVVLQYMYADNAITFTRDLPPYLRF